MRVHNCYHRVEPDQRRQIDVLSGALICKGLGHRNRFANSRGFDQNIIEASLRSQLVHLAQQIVPQRAADAAIGHLDQLLLGP
ncbi:hypothetical protein D3C73_1410030 [compost metagenome]